MRRRGRLALAAAFIAFSALIIAPLSAPTTAAYAATYPTWDDVIRARNDENAAKQAVQRIQQLLAQLAAEVQRTQQDLDQKTAKWYELQARYEAKQAEAANLKSQADAAAVVAADSEQRAGAWAAQVVKVNGSDPALNLFVQADDASKILGAIGVTSRLSEQANALYEQATQQRNVAASLTAQASVAEEELSKLAQEANDAMVAAQAASEAAQKAVEEEEAHRAELQSQLEILSQRRQLTEADYQAGVRAREEERRRQLAAQQAAWAAVSASGWVRPAAGFISSWFGARAGLGYHHGIDFANACGATVLAAYSGTVIYAGYAGDLGYYMEIDHGGGVMTGYGHQLAGGFRVSVGQHVSAGQRIGTVGRTGVATGCHLHLDVYVNGVRIDPAPFLRAKGISL